MFIPLLCHRYQKARYDQRKDKQNLSDLDPAYPKIVRFRIGGAMWIDGAFKQADNTSLAVPNPRSYIRNSYVGF